MPSRRTWPGRRRDAGGERCGSFEPRVAPAGGQVAGEISAGLFALGIVSPGMLANPAMAGSASYALSEAWGKKQGPEPQAGRRPVLLRVIAASMPTGLALNFIGANPIRALVFVAVFNGAAAIPLVWFIDRIAAGRATMGDARSGWLSGSMLALTFVGMAGSVVAVAISFIKG